MFPVFCCDLPEKNAWCVKTCCGPSMCSGECFCLSEESTVFKTALVTSEESVCDNVFQLSFNVIWICFGNLFHSGC